MQKQRAEFESFADGRVRICRPGEGEAFVTLDFGEERVGVTRYYQALNADVHIVRVIHIPQRRDVEANFLAEIGGDRFIIKEAQHKNDTLPRTTVLALAEM